MNDKPQQDGFRLGFLATASLPENTFVGGLLITNRLGRPLEFQCTAPVQPNRTQALLYGPTLQPYVLTELIGKTLVEKASIRPDLILVDTEELLPIREHVAMPVACLCDSAERATSQIGTQALTWHIGFPADAGHADQLRKHLPAEADLTEPFERVRAALKEAVGVASAA